MADSSVGTIGVGLEANASGFQNEIQNILNNTESSVRTRVTRLGNIYRQQGMSRSAAMRRAWAEVRETTSSSCNNMVRSSETATGKISNAFSGIGSKIAAAFSVVAITAFTKKMLSIAQECTKAAEIQTNAEVKLTTIMKQRMQATSESIKSVEAFTSAQQELGVVGDEVQLAGTQQLATFLNTDIALKSLIPAMNNLAVQQNGVNVTSESMVNIGNLMGKVMQGQTAALTRVGITFSEAEEQVLKYGNEQEKAAMLAQVITNNVGEMNKAIASTPAGQMQKVKNNLSDINETFGRAINNIFVPLVKYLDTAVSKLAELANGFEEVTKKFFGDSNNKDVSTSGVGMVSESADTATESLEETEEQAKKLEKRLSGFDELNVLDNDEDESNGADSTTTSDTDSVESANNALTSTEKSLDNITDKLKKIGKELGFDKLADNIQKGFNKVNWGAIKGNIDSIFSDLQPIAQSTFNGIKKITKSSMNTLGKFAGGAVSVVGKQLQTVTGGVSKWLDNDKTKIVTGITEISNNISSGIDNIGNFYDSIFSTLGDSIDRMRPTAENAIATLLSGFSNLGLSVGNILSSAFNIVTENIATWAINNQTTIGTFFDNIQCTFAQVSEFLGGIMTDVSDILTGWWYNGGAVIFDEVCRAFTDIGTTIMNVYNQWIQPAIDCVIGIFSDCWEYTLKPIFEQVVSVVGKIGECVASVWNNFLSPIVNWLINTLAPVVKTALNIVRGVFETVFKVIGDVISGFLKAIGGVIDFITGVFQGDWKKAWNGIFTVLDGVWQMIWGCIKGVVNLIVDGINTPVGGIYSVFATIANVIGEAAGVIGSLFGQDWSFSMPAEWTPIPKLAKGGIVKAPTLALVGDNAGAGTGNPEVVAPLNKLQGMLQASDGSAEDTAILSQILQYMIKIYELMLNSGTDIYEFVAQLDGDIIFKKMIEANNKYKKRHGGKSAFA